MRLLEGGTVKLQRNFYLGENVQGIRKNVQGIRENVGFHGLGAYFLKIQIC